MAPEPLALNLTRRRLAFEALREFVGDALANQAILVWEHDALLALFDSLSSQSPTTAQGRARHGFVR